MQNTNNLVQGLNSAQHVHFLQRLTLHDKRVKYMDIYAHWVSQYCSLCAHRFTVFILTVFFIQSNFWPSDSITGNQKKKKINLTELEHASRIGMKFSMSGGSSNPIISLRNPFN